MPVNELIENFATVISLLKDRQIIASIDIIVIFGKQKSEIFNLIDSNFQKKNKRWLTKNLYEQERYNLLLENPNGYAVLIAELVLLMNETYLENTCQTINHRLDCVIGEFNLDPVRVCDILMDILVLNPSKNYLDLLNRFTAKTVEDLLNSKLKCMDGYCKVYGDVTMDEISLSVINEESNVKNSTLVDHSSVVCTPDSSFNGVSDSQLLPAKMLLFCNSLIEMGILNINQIWEMLSPRQEEDIIEFILRKDQLSFNYFEKDFYVLMKTDEKKLKQLENKHKNIVNFFKYKNTAHQSRHSWMKLKMLEVFLETENEKAIDWVLARWGNKMDWLISAGIYKEVTRLLSKLISQSYKK